MTGRSKRKLHSNISIKEVAQSLNVSAATVSRALSRPELLNKETRVRILEAVEHMGYRPNLIARGLRLKKTQLLFVVVPTLSPFFLEVFRGVERAARETNYSVLMGHTNREISRELIFIDQALAQRADGIVLVTSSSQNELVDRQGSLPPLVAICRIVSSPTGALSCGRKPKFAPRSHSIRPSSGWSLPRMMLKRVDFPAPLAPTSPSRSVRAIFSETSANKVRGP